MQFMKERNPTSVKCDYRMSQAGHLQDRANKVHKGKNLNIRFQVNSSKMKFVTIGHIQAVSNLQMHIDAVHEGNNSYKSQMCDNRIFQARSLWDHVDTVHKGKKLVRYQVCDYRSTTNSNLQMHIVVVHEGNKIYKSQMCDYRTSQAEHLWDHIDK